MSVGTLLSMSEGIVTGRRWQAHLHLLNFRAMTLFTP